MLAYLASGLVLAADPDPTIAMLGQIAAIVILVFLFVFVLLTLAFNLAMAFGLKWLRDKTEAIKMLRPKVESLNKSSEVALQGVEPAANENALVRSVSQLPPRVQSVDKKVEEVSDRVAHAVIEFRARTVQAKTIVKAFFLPGAMRTKHLPEKTVEESGLEFKSPGYRILMEKKAPEVPVETETSDGHAQTVTASQLKDAAVR
jgi:hypothetical protein